MITDFMSNLLSAFLRDFQLFLLSSVNVVISEPLHYGQYVINVVSVVAATTARLDIPRLTAGKSVFYERGNSLRHVTMGFSDVDESPAHVVDVELNLIGFKRPTALCACAEVKQVVGIVELCFRCRLVDEKVTGRRCGRRIERYVVGNDVIVEQTSPTCSCRRGVIKDRKLLRLLAWRRVYGVLRWRARGTVIPSL